MVVSATRGQAGQIRGARVATRRTIAAVREAELRLAADGAASGGDVAARPPVATAELDVTSQIEAKVGALCAYRSQFPLEPGMFPDLLLREMFGKEYFVRVLPPRQTDTELL